MFQVKGKKILQCYHPSIIKTHNFKKAHKKKKIFTKRIKNHILHKQ